MIVNANTDAQWQGPTAADEGHIVPMHGWQKLALAAVLLVAAFVNFFQLQVGTIPNLYYGAAIKSMLMSWHNFFFVSFDPGGFVSIDKPPLGFWIQTASAKIFGLSTFSVLLPEALAGFFSVVVLYILVRRVFGTTPALLAALTLALTPISIVTNRNNTIDSLLVLFLLLAAWAVAVAAETGRLRWLLLCALLVGLGFNIKMLEAYLVVPAFALVYLLGAPLRWRTRLLHLLLAGLLLIAVSLSWATIVDMTPSSQRPFVGSSGGNSVLELALGYNGWERLSGMGRGGGNRGGIQQREPTSAQRNTTSGLRERDEQLQPPTQRNATGGGMFGGETGAAGPFRLFNNSLGGQIGWLLPLALFGMLALAWQSSIRFPLNRQQKALVMWGGWLLTTAAFFSVAGFFHTYYLTTLAPSLAALVGIGVAAMWQAYSNQGWRGWLLPVALLATAAVQAYILLSYPAWSTWLTPIVLIGSLLAALLLVLLRLFKPRAEARPELARRSSPWRGLSYAAITLGTLVLLVVPGVWDGISLAMGDSRSTLPSAGPRASSFAFRPTTDPATRTVQSGRGTSTSARDFPTTTTFPGINSFGRGDNALISYLEQHQGNTKYLLATMEANTAAPIILSTGRPVMALGGFSGNDDILTVQQLEGLIKNDSVRYFELSGVARTNLSPQILERLEQAGGGMGGFGAGGRRNQELTAWIGAHCSTVPASQWQGSSQNTSGNVRGGMQLYDCGTLH